MPCRTDIRIALRCDSSAFTATIGRLRARTACVAFPAAKWIAERGDTVWLWPFSQRDVVLFLTARSGLERALTFRIVG